MSIPIKSISFNRKSAFYSCSNLIFPDFSKCTCVNSLTLGAYCFNQIGTNAYTNSSSISLKLSYNITTYNRYVFANAGPSNHYGGSAEISFGTSSDTGKSKDNLSLTFNPGCFKRRDNVSWTSIIFYGTFSSEQ